VPKDSIVILGDGVLQIRAAIRVAGDTIRKVKDAIRILRDAIVAVGDAIVAVGDAIVAVGDAVVAVGDAIMMRKLGSDVLIYQFQKNMKISLLIC
jgi:hypothetical protein